MYLELIPLLGLGIFNFWLIFPFAVVGLIVLAQRRRSCIGLLFLFIVALCLGVLLFHVQGRYRIPAVPFFILPAAWTLKEIIKIIQEQDARRFGFMFILILAIMFAIAPDSDIIRTYFGGIVRPYDYTNWAIANNCKTLEQQDDLTQDEMRAAAEKTLYYTEKFFQTPQPLLQGIPPEHMRDKIYLRDQLRAYLQK